MNFDKIVGHRDIIEGLQMAIDNRQVSHSYLFQGEESVGKKKLALVFAKTLLCDGKGNEPCDKCISCIKFDKQNHPDFLLIESENNIIRKEKIDNLLKAIQTYPLEGDRKIVIIDNSQDMRLEAQNALLKTLEEPPEYMNIFLITENSQNLIGTIQSRCQIINFYPVDTRLIEEILIGDYSKTREEAKFIANFTKGAVGQSIKISESEDFFAMRNGLLDIIDKIIIDGDKTRVFSSKDFFEEYKGNYKELLDILIYWFRDLYIFKEIGKNELIVNNDRYLSLEDQSFLSFTKINDIIDNIIKIKKDISMNINYQLGIETMLLNMQEVYRDGKSSRGKI